MNEATEDECEDPLKDLNESYEIRLYTDDPKDIEAYKKALDHYNRQYSDKSPP